MTAIKPGVSDCLRIVAGGIGTLAMAVGLSVLIGGWALGIESLTSVVPGLTIMKPNTAVGITAIGAGLTAAQWGRSGRRLGRAAAAVAVAIGALTLLEHLLDWDAGIDQLLFDDRLKPRRGVPGRPSAASAATIALLGLALLSTGHRLLQGLRTWASYAALLIAWAALNGYVFGAHELGEVVLFSSLALPTAAMSLLVGVGVLATEPVSWPVRILFAKGPAGVVCRWLLPAAIIAPPILGWFLSRAGVELSPSAFRWALYSVFSSTGAVALILLLAHRIALIDAARSEATALSLRDPLTGLANRRAFDAFLQESFGLTRRHGHALSLLMLDIDWFKSYNDAYGHPAGDELLGSVAACLRDLARETDLVARVGGEEFAIVLPETDLTGARAFADRVRAEVERTRVFRRRVTVSIGVATLSENMADPTALLREGDSALYHAKRGGRNRVSCAGIPAPLPGRAGR